MIERLNTLSRLERIGAHSHIGDLGVSEDLLELSEDGIVGHHSLRKRLSLLCRLARNSSGKTVILSGPTGSGKSALIAGLVGELKKTNTPTVVITASEIFSSTLSKIEILTQALRQSLGIEVKEASKILAGEVVNLQIDRESGQTGKIVLKTTDVEGVFTLGDKIIEQLYQKRVEIGDVVQINRTTGSVRRVGRSLSRAKEYEAIGPGANFVPCPEGELLTVKEEPHTVSFHEIDVLNSRTQGYLSLNQATSEIPLEIRESVDISMKEWIEEGRGVLRTGALVIEESQLLDSECYSYLNTLSEMKISPVVVLSTCENVEDVTKAEKEADGVKDAEKRCSVPKDFVSRSLLLKTCGYTEKQLEKIVRNRIREENAKIEESGVVKLARVAKEHGIRYSFNLISAADVLSNRTGKVTDAGSVDSLCSMFPPESSFSI